MKLWIARDRCSRDLYIYVKKPRKMKDTYYSDDKFYTIDRYLFPEVTFENSLQMVEIKLVKEEVCGER